jgi:hypothetical protein
VCPFDCFHGRNEIGRVEPVSGHESFFVSNPFPMSVILSMDVLPASIASLGAKVEQLSGGIDPGHCLLDARFVIRPALGEKSQV